MFPELSESEFLRLAKSHEYVIAYRELPADSITPITAYQLLARHHPSMVLLESTAQESQHARYSHLFFEPTDTLTLSKSHEKNDEYLDSLRACAARYQAGYTHPLSRLAGSLVGYFSYDAVRLFETLPDRHEKTSVEIPDAEFSLYHSSISFDHKTQRYVIATLVHVSEKPQEDYREAVKKLDVIVESLQQSPPKEKPFYAEEKQTIQVDTTDLEFETRVEKAQQYIHAGDAFQIVLSREFSVPYSGDGFQLYRALRLVNPSPYLFYIERDGVQIAGCSPEKLVSVQEGLIESCPLAGTRRRGTTPEEDVELAHDLAFDQKELAEHRMLVDLHRNDVGAVAKPGTVKVVKKEKIERYSRVMHLSSTVQGELHEDYDAFNALKAAFPAGTLSGAPKIRAMEIIDELESSRRGLYGGAICAFDNAGNLESCIAIRMVIIKDGVAYVRSGAGVVLDSDPRAEARETRQKAQAMFDGIFLASGASK